MRDHKVCQQFYLFLNSSRCPMKLLRESLKCLNVSGSLVKKEKSRVSNAATFCLSSIKVRTPLWPSLIFPRGSISTSFTWMASGPTTQLRSVPMSENHLARNMKNMVRLLLSKYKHKAVLHFVLPLFIQRMSHTGAKLLCLLLVKVTKISQKSHNCIS